MNLDEQKRWTARRKRTRQEASAFLKTLEGDGCMDSGDFWRVWHVDVAKTPFERIAKLEEQVEYLTEQLKLSRAGTEPPVFPMDHTFEI